MKKIYDTPQQRKLARAKQKRILREKKRNELTNTEWISQILIRLVNVIPRKSEVLKRRKSFEIDSTMLHGLLDVHPNVPNVLVNRPTHYAK